ncbi:MULTISPECIES: HAMP domain-containing sensor histidine kinase [unclassified Mesorhizobium]|uniref:ATP-binding protein n=1 Tax=unclassified Mesorhizobium TaxID=325217 RepID=UPI00112A0D05|nr:MULTISPECIES: HAMP domain-containing sensor histidine kinase [unclassified Mesorhizobium]TPN44852.1 HAMP domain-containing histidine kinase [Mesorhizobium sp. B1-1-7]TPN46629.1 HAMP domain-containing histidine kinase [Mesorhizobium sp. B1-1-9]
MRDLARRFLPQSVRGQFAAIIFTAVIVIMSVGSVVEGWIENVDLPVVEDCERRAAIVAALLRETPSEARGALLATATRAGFDFKILPKEQTHTIPFSYLQSRSIEWLFVIDRGMVDGHWTRIGGQYAYVVDLDQQSVLAHFGMPDSWLTSGFVRALFYRFMAFVALPVLIWLFAVWAVTDPLKRISAAVGEAEIENGNELFAERGSIEMVGLARALNTMRTRIRTMIENRTRMLRSVSHDLRTPLTRLRLRAERMDDGSVRTAILSDVQHIEDLIDETLTYLRNDVSTEKLQRADIASVLQTVCAEFSDVGFSVTYSGPDRLLGWCKPNALARAITNLCDNGFKFAGNVTVALTQADTAARIAVGDDGPGISMTARSSVFEPFFKEDMSRGVASKHGFGLGLSIVADIIQGHGGKIELHDNEPNGLVVTIDLPNGPKVQPL